MKGISVVSLSLVILIGVVTLNSRGVFQNASSETTGKTNTVFEPNDEPLTLSLDDEVLHLNMRLDSETGDILLGV